MLAPLLALALTATSPAAVVARVGNDVITGGEVLARAHALHARPSAALDDLVREALVASLARSAGLASEPRVREALAQERRHGAVDALLAREVLSKSKVTDAEVSNEFHDRQDAVRISMVVRATEREALETLQRLRAGSGVIEEARSSIDPVGRAKSGVMGWFRRDQITPELREAAFAAPIGQPAGPAPVQKGFAVFVVHERRVGDGAALRRDAPLIRRELEQARRNERAGQLISRLRARAGAKVDGDFLRSTGDGLDRDAWLDRAAATDGVSTVRYRDVVGAMREAARGGAPPRDVSPEAKERMAWRIVDGRLLEREALRRGLDRLSSTAGAMRGTTRLVLARAYAQHVAERVPAPTDAEIAARYARRTDDYWVPSHRSCVLLDARDEAHASQVRARVAAGEPWERVGREYVDPSTGYGLEPVQFTDANLDAMSTDQNDQHVLAWTIRKSKPGEWTVVESRGRWLVVQCGAQQPTRRRPLAEVREEIAAAMRQERVAKAIDERVAELRRVTSIRTYPKALSDDAT